MGEVSLGVIYFSCLGEEGFEDGVEGYLFEGPSLPFLFMAGL